MRILSVVLARAAWIIDLQRLNPTGRSLLDVLAGLRERYRFSKAPKHALDFNKDGALEFQVGAFSKGGESIAVGLNIYGNGLAGDTLSSTDDAEMFLEDIANWLAQEHKLAIPSTAIQRKFYVSHLDVELKTPLVFVNPRLAELSQKISNLAKGPDGRPKQFDFSSIGWWSEDVGQREAPSPFRFERRWGKPFSDNSYLTIAPLRTQEHLQVLEDLERILTTSVQ